jgi:hypothetical protein
MSDADAPWKWLEYRVSNSATGLASIYTLDSADRMLCKTRTVLFIASLIKHPNERIPVPDAYRHLDMFGPLEIEDALRRKVKNYGKESLSHLYELFLSRREPLMPLALFESEFTTWLLNGFPTWRKEHPQSDIIGMMDDVLGGGDKYAAYATMREIFAIALSQTLSTALAETGFSGINASKRPQTNGLIDPTLHDINNIKFNGPLEMPVYIFLL